MNAAAYARILVPLDGSARAERILPYVQPLAAKFGAVVTFLYATVPAAEAIAGAGMPAAVAVAPVLGPGLPGDLGPPEGTGQLEAVADRLRASGLTVELEMPEGSAASAIAPSSTKSQARSPASRLSATASHWPSMSRKWVGRLLDDPGVSR